MDKSLQKSILEITLDANDLYVFDSNPSSEVGALGRNLPSSFGQIPPEMLQPEGQIESPYYPNNIQQDKEVEGLENHKSHAVQPDLHTTATDSESWFNAKGQLVIIKVSCATLMKVMTEYLASAKHSHPSNTKLAWPVEGMSKSKKAKWCEKSKAYEFKNGVLYYHHSVKDQMTGVVESKHEICLIYDFTINRISFYASSKSVSNSLPHLISQNYQTCVLILHVPYNQSIQLKLSLTSPCSWRLCKASTLGFERPNTCNQQEVILDRIKHLKGLPRRCGQLHKFLPQMPGCEGSTPAEGQCQAPQCGYA